MSSKERVIDWLQRLPDGLGVAEILGALEQQFLQEKSQANEPPADYEWPTADVTEDEWRQFVAHGLRNELADPREDIYTGEEGTPSHEQG